MGGSVLVTGATGFLGRALVEELQGQGYRVHALVRSASALALPLSEGVVPHAGELEDAGALERACTALAVEEPGAWVVHSAAVISYRTADRERQREVNVAGTKRLLDALRGAGLARLCLVGSVVNVGTAPDGRASLTEDAAWNLKRARSAYADTKRQQEQLAFDFARDHGLDLRVVLPGAIFGRSPRPSNTARFVSEVRRRGAPPLVPPGSLGVVGLEDVARGLRLALERGRPGGRYLLVESNWRLREAFALVARLAGARAPLGTLPAPLWRAIVLGARVVDRVHPLDLLAPEALELLGRHFRFDASRARIELGWTPQPFERVIEGILD